MKNYPKHDDASRRIHETGPQSLNTAELLAVALRINENESAKLLAEEYQNYGRLAAIPRHRITDIKGMGDKYANSVLAICELVRREIASDITEKPSIHSPGDVASLVQYEMGVLDHEELWVILLDTRQHVKRIVKLYKGTINQSAVRVSEIFREAIIDNAPNIIICHNHPSGDPTPSSEDISLTRAAIQAGKLMDVDMLDHIVIGSGKYISLKERGIKFD